ncbi:DEAD-domain-containing protein [Annulohypoxylon maeteangense]|uniref:DEAD-domain-containing protein n=1 Tax=Annulohypoxylon maeteangense TaxID=1927788 RepID=UPI0020078F18|nr:DEAD-domain-containing protein [Annulohypoxylon maeteangense]KAI0887101.1 DEAD-domain-containing protein [Annulohypoxylon maeteangense]
MKRKLNEKDEPVSVAKQEATSVEETPSGSTFADLGLDSRLLQATAHQNWQTPTLVQRKAIPLAIEGCDVLAKAKTGSGKTAAYTLPLLQAILKRKQTSSDSYTAALILVPTNELVTQVTKVLDSLTSFCSREIKVSKLSDKLSDAAQRAVLSDSPDVVVATPSRAWHNIKNSALSLERLTHLVLDEADLVLSYGYDEDLQNVASSLPKGLQTTLMSATLTSEVHTLKGLFCRNPTILDLEEPEEDGGVSQYIVKCGEDEKFLLIYCMIKLELIKGKAIIFVSDVDRCYRLKLFFEQFGIRSCLLNSELPVNCRIHAVEEFNRGVYNIIIASDENEVIGDEKGQTDLANEEIADSNLGNASNEAPEKSNQLSASASSAKKRKSSRRDKNYGVSRGIDFQNVAIVINFDLPLSSRSYLHRIGRTARAGQTGMALSFVVPKEKFRKHMPTSIDTAEHDEKVLSKIIRQQEKRGHEVKPYSFDMKAVEAFRYRLNDALRAVTKVAIREARLRELKQELLKSESLKRHFEENPLEVRHLRHDVELRTTRSQPHLKHVPDYLLPKDGKKAITPNEVGFVPFKKVLDGKGRRGRISKGRGRRIGSRRNDPLKSFKARSKPKK